MDLDNENITPQIDNSNQTFTEPIFKKWFKTSSAAGFLSITPWDGGNKFVVDIGATDPSGGSVKSSTKCFVDPVELGLYLQSVVNNSAVDLYPKRSGCPSSESFIGFGGSGTVSRVFKVHYWGAKSDVEGTRSGFAWKCGHFEGTVSNSGAIQPNYDKQLSTDMIKVSLLEMHEIEYRLRMYITAKFSDPKWYGVKS